MILPRVKEEKMTGEHIRLNYHISFGIDNLQYEENVCKVLSLFFPNATVSTVETPDITMVFSDSCQKTPEKYAISIDEKIRIQYGDYKSLVNALASLAQLAQEKDGYAFPKCEIVDYPDCSYRGALLDVARGVKPFDVFKADIVTCGKAKFNIIHFHLNDNDGSCVKLDSIPESCCIENAYTKEQLVELIALCELLGIEAVPEFDIPFHGRKFTTEMPNLRCVVPSIEKISLWAMCGGNEDTYKFCESVIDELCGIFPGKYFDMCCDEVEFGDMPWNYLCHWTECETCKALRKREGIKDRQDQIYYFMNRMYEIVKKHSKTPMIFSDQIDCKRPDPLPKDVIFVFWTIAYPGRGPYEGCSYEKQLAFGHKVVRTECKYTYLEAVKWINAEILSRWDIKEAPTMELSKNVIGSLLACWQYGNHIHSTIQYQLRYQRGFAPAVYLFSDRLWNDGEIFYKEKAYSAALTKAVLGQKTPPLFDAFGKLADLIPYSQEIEEIVDKNTLSLEEAKEILAVLQTESQGSDTYAKNAKVMEQIYAEAVNYLS